MKISDIALLSAVSLGERKFRFALNLIGILIGCAAVTGLVSLTQGLSRDVNEQLEVFGPTNIVVIPGEFRPGQGIVAGTLGWRDLEIISKVSDIEMATPIIANKFCQFKVRGTTYRADVFGITHEYFMINKNTNVEDGRALVRTDKAATVIGSNIHQPVWEDEPVVEVGDRIRIEVRVGEEERTMTLRVVGILEETGGSFGVNLDDSISIPLRTVQQLYDVGGEFDYIVANTETLEQVDGVVDGIEEKLGESVTVVSYASAKELVGEVLDTIQAVLGGIAAISLFVAGIGIINTMTISVMERTREIGVMKAIGAKSRDILMMFLSEALLTGIVGGFIGTLLGMVLSLGVGRLINMASAPSLGLGIGVIGFAVITGTISGLYPAWRAAKLNPVEALRYE